MAAGAALFALGMLFPLLVFNPAWWGSWMAAGVSTAVGVLLGIAHLVVRRVAPVRT